MDESNFKIDVLYVYIDKKRKYTQNCKEKLNKYSHSQWLFYEFVSKITNNLVKQSLRVTVCLLNFAVDFSDSLQKKKYAI